ncbi:MAG: hypothetical protein PHF18_17040 [Methanosarcina sp.]|uniref:phosphoribosyltransferase-like protein n=1 Tax=Methanosarcina sp. TaxID=2213 RepID=UPI002636A2FD|nr:hypothetical protein [Methanosarcina sp.]MDD3248537.1 hypothetical protein [Methanosarcina sp.]MDD4249452.1 hypothetical protein [Methanosarcina sp.]
MKLEKPKQTENIFGSTIAESLKLSPALKSISTMDLVPKLGINLPSIYSSIHSPLSILQACLDKEQITRLQSSQSSSCEETDLTILPEDLFNISKRQKKIILFEFFNLDQKEEINNFFRLSSKKDLVIINYNKSKEVIQRSINHLALNIDLPKNVLSMCVHSGYFFGHHFALIFECHLSIVDLNEMPSKNGFEGLNERFNLFEDLHAQIENSLPEQFHGFFFKNELRFEERKLKLPSMYVYDINNYNFIFEDDIEDKKENSIFQLKSPFDTPTLKGKAYDFFLEESNMRAKAVGYDPLLCLGIRPEILFAQISDKLICSQSNVYFESHLGSIPSNFIIFEFNEGQIIDFALEFVKFYYLYVTFEKQLLILSNINIPEVHYLITETLEKKNKEILIIKHELDKINTDVFVYSQIFDSLNIENLKFSQEETRDIALPIGKCGDNDSISQFFSDHIIYSKKRLEEKLAHLQQRVSEIEVSITNELKIKKTKPKVNHLFNKIESDLIQQIIKWDGTVISQNKIESWLLNFRTTNDRKIALKLLDKLTYITYNDVRALAKSAYGLLLFSIKANDLTNCYVSNVGGLPSGSTHLAKIFAEENQINDKLLIQFENLELLTEKRDKTLVLIDDFIGSGSTYVKWYKNHTDQLSYFSKIIYVSVTGLLKGINTIENETKTEVLCANIFNEDDQVIDGTLFDSEDRQMIIKLIDRYSSIIGSEHVYGRDNCQLLLAFEYNIPNSSIGILWWSNNNWTPLISRK